MNGQYRCRLLDIVSYRVGDPFEIPLPSGKLKRIDVTANDISSVDDGAFSTLPVLEELVIRENHVSQLPALPVTMTLIDASHNEVGARGIHKEAFKVLPTI